MLNGGIDPMQSDEEAGRQTDEKPAPQPHRVRLPGFISDEDIGLGEVIKQATSYVGIKPCGGCEQRAAALNRWMVISGRRKR
jgi:hypothetical protein